MFERERLAGWKNDLRREGGFMLYYWLGKKIPKSSAFLNKKSHNGTVLPMSLLVMVILLLLALAYLTCIERHHRFAALQLRQEQAWYLALAGEQYYKTYCSANQAAGELPGNTCLKAEPVAGLGVTKVRVYLPSGQTSQYFELLEDEQGHWLSRGVSKAGFALDNSSAAACERRLLLAGKGVSVSYDSSLSP